jgi:hypothetical protein
LPELWLMVGARLAVALFLMMPAVSMQVRGNLSYVIVSVLAGLLAVGIQAHQSGMTNLRGQCAADLAMMVFVLPPLVLGGFVAAETRSLLPAERSALLQAGAGVLISFSLLIAVSALISDGKRLTIATLALPGLLMIPALSFVLHDYRNQTVIAMMVVVYFIAALSTILASALPDMVRPYVPALLYAATVLAGMIVLSPGTANLGERDTIIALSGWMMILSGQAALVAIPATAAGLMPDIQWGIKNGQRPRTVDEEESHDDERADSPDRGAQR